MRTAPLAASIALACMVATNAFGATQAALARPASAAADSTSVTLAGVAWEGSWLRACERAEREGKPVLFLHMLGRLDEELC